MTRRGLVAAAGIACALAVPVSPAGAATSSVPVGSTTTSVSFCSGGPAGISNPGATAPSGCQGGSSGAMATMCKDADVHAFVQTQQMMDGKRPALAPLAGTVMVHLQSATFGSNLNVDTFAGSGAALAQVGSLPPGAYDATATLWAGTTVNPDGTSSSYPSSSMSMKLTVSDQPCGGTTPTSTGNGSGKNGCGLGDTKHERTPEPGKCPAK